MNEPCQKVIAALRAHDWNVREFHGRMEGEVARAQCPAHRGHGLNLAVGIGCNGGALLHCYSHDCNVEDIVAALGLQVPDLYPTTCHRGSGDRVRGTQGPQVWWGVAACLDGLADMYERAMVGDQRAFHSMKAELNHARQAARKALRENQTLRQRLAAQTTK